MYSQFANLCRESTLYKAWNEVKSKGSAGGIDGITVDDFNKDKIHQIKGIQLELTEGSWKPLPYLQIAIPKRKNPEEMRILGMAAIKDKIVQQAIRQIIEPRLERLFVPNSYAYRPGKGALKTIRYVVKQTGNSVFQYALRLDIDNFFDEVDHEILRKRLISIGLEDEIVRLIMLSVKMGRVRHKHFYVVTYDIGDTKRRNRVVKIMESLGTRMNYSVFECMLTEVQYKSMCKRLAKILVRREDWINIYPICSECFARIEYIPPIKKKEPVKIAVV